MKILSNEQLSKDSDNLCVHQLIENQVARTPDSIAITCEDDSLTYEELNRRSTKLAHYLSLLGVRAETPVGIYIERSPEALIGMLGILKAGGAYLPLDLNYPKERIAFILEDSGASLLLTSSNLSKTSLPNSVRAVYLNMDDSYLESRTDPSSLTNSLTDNLAYIIYTSGSTGKPKGVQIRHLAVVNLLDSTRRKPGIDSEDRLLAVTTFSFDISVLELFLPLTVGACVVLTTEWAADPARLATQVVRDDITIMQATPSLWQCLLDIGWPSDGHLKILCGGEAFPRLLASELISHSDDVWNMYGPTETTIWSSIYRVAREHEGSIPIGIPIENTQMYLLNEDIQEISTGAPAQLYIGGDGLARGYHGRPDLTAERFIPDPFSDLLGSRLYHTGDIVCRRPDGLVEYLGREDFQVKVRGVRIELGEIETALELYPGIRQAVTTVREDVPGDKRIVAYYVSVNGLNLTGSSLRQHLRTSLPEYMIPSKYVRLEAVPLMANGKVDRSVLPAPPLDRIRLSKEFVPPQTEFEKEVAEIWSTLLGFDEVGLHDYFFELGGHSLLVMQVISRVNDAFRISLSISNVLTKGMTVAELVVLIENALFEQAQDEDLSAALRELENSTTDQATARI